MDKNAKIRIAKEWIEDAESQEEINVKLDGFENYIKSWKDLKLILYDYLQLLEKNMMEEKMKNILKNNS